MAAARKYSVEFQERATRLAMDGPVRLPCRFKLPRAPTSPRFSRGWCALRGNDPLTVPPRQQLLGRSGEPVMKPRAPLGKCSRPGEQNPTMGA